MAATLLGCFWGWLHSAALCQIRGVSDGLVAYLVDSLSYLGSVGKLQRWAACFKQPWILRLLIQLYAPCCFTIEFYRVSCKVKNLKYDDSVLFMQPKLLLRLPCD